MQYSADALVIKAKVDEWRQFAPSLKVLFLQDGDKVQDKRPAVVEFVAHTSPLYWSKK